MQRCDNVVTFIFLLKAKQEAVTPWNQWPVKFCKNFHLLLLSDCVALHMIFQIPGLQDEACISKGSLLITCATFLLLQFPIS